MFHIFLVFFLAKLKTCIPDVFDEEAEEHNKEEEDDQNEQEQEVWAPICLEFSSDILGFWNMSEIRCWILMFQIMKAVELYQGETFGFSWDMLGSHKVGDGLRVDLDLVQLQLRQRQLWALLAISSSSKATFSSSKATFGKTSRDCLFSEKELLSYSQRWFI